MDERAPRVLKTDRSRVDVDLEHRPCRARHRAAADKRDPAALAR